MKLEVNNLKKSFGEAEMKNSSCFFENRECEYFPCHKGLEHFNCMFCYCPLYGRENCPGNPEYIEIDGKRIKSCENCVFPHQPESYEVMLQFIPEFDNEGWG